MSEHDTDHGYSRLAVWGNALVAIIITALVIWWASAFDVGFEQLFRVSPTPDVGIGADFVQGNSIGWLAWLIKLIHLADVVMGLFILVMVFVHWGAFRRLATRMRRPDEESEATEAATDGGEPKGGDSAPDSRGGDTP